LQNYLGTYFPQKNNLKLLKAALEENIIVKFIDNNKESHTTFKSIENNYNEFILASNMENKSLIRKVTNLPIMLAMKFGENGTYDPLYNILIKLYKFTPKIIVHENKAYQVIYKGDYKKYKELNKKIKDLSVYRVNDLQFVEAKYISVKVSKNKKELQKMGMYHSDLIVNANHPYLKFILEHYNSIKDKTEFEKIIKSSFEIIREISDGKRVVLKKLNELNEIIKPLEVIDKPWVFTKEDFQPTNK
jgi:hypothetical protein